MTQSFHVKTYKGLEPILAEELRQIGASDVNPVNRGVDFSGSMAMMYKANLYLRTALRILMPIARFKAIDENMLYRKIMGIDWSQYMSYKNSLAIDAVTFSSVFRNNLYVEQKIKDAIVDQFRNKTSLRPTIDLKNADIRVNVHLNETYFTISLDSSGESLHKRGYRKEMHPASLSEVLAAGMILLTGWKGDRTFINPMCGSGTVAIEAAMIASDIYPGATGRSYAFQHWPEYDPVLFDRLMEAMPAPKVPVCKIIASDIDSEAIRITKANARAIGLEKTLDILKEDFFKSKEQNEASLIILNPPYGERLIIEDIDQFYASLGSVLKHKYPGSEAWILSANISALKFIGLKSDRKLPLFNAGLDCRYQKYTLYRGTHKGHKSTSV